MAARVLCKQRKRSEARGSPCLLAFPPRRYISAEILAQPPPPGLLAALAPAPSKKRKSICELPAQPGRAPQPRTPFAPAASATASGSHAPTAALHPHCMTPCSCRVPAVRCPDRAPAANRPLPSLTVRPGYWARSAPGPERLLRPGCGAFSAPRPLCTLLAALRLPTARPGPAPLPCAAAGAPVPVDAPFEITYLNARLPVAGEDELQQVGAARQRRRAASCAPCAAVWEGSAVLLQLEAFVAGPAPLYPCQVAPRAAGAAGRRSRAVLGCVPRQNCATLQLLHPGGPGSTRVQQRRQRGTPRPVALAPRPRASLPAAH